MFVAVVAAIPYDIAAVVAVAAIPYNIAAVVAVAVAAVSYEIAIVIFPVRNIALLHHCCQYFYTAVAVKLY